MAGGMSVPEGETTIRHLRSASWYGNQVHEQLKTISNRAEFLSEEVAAIAAMQPGHGTSTRELLNEVKRMTRPPTSFEARFEDFHAARPTPLNFEQWIILAISFCSVTAGISLFADRPTPVVAVNGASADEHNGSAGSRS